MENPLWDEYVNKSSMKFSTISRLVGSVKKFVPGFIILEVVNGQKLSIWLKVLVNLPQA